MSQTETLKMWVDDSQTGEFIIDFGLYRVRMSNAEAIEFATDVVRAATCTLEPMSRPELAKLLALARSEIEQFEDTE